MRTYTKLKKAILAAGVKQIWLSQQTGINYTYLSRMVTGDMLPDDDDKRAIALALRVQVKDIF